LGCVSPADHRVAAAIYYATESFRTKLSVTDAAIRVALEGQPKLAEWKTLHDDVRKKSMKRNQLAHHEVLFQPKRCEGKRYMLVDSVLCEFRFNPARYSDLIPATIPI
jgi:hypothetical protein